MNEHTEIIEKITSLLEENKDKEKIRVSIELLSKKIQGIVILKHNPDYSLLIQVNAIYEEEDVKKVMYKVPRLLHVAVKHIKNIRVINPPPINNECN